MTLPVRPDDYVDFIDAAYAAPEEPERFDDLVAIAQRLIAHLPGEQAPQSGADVRLSMDERFAPHTQRLARAIEREDALFALAGAETFHAQLTVSRPDLTVHGNAAAERLMGRAFPCSLCDLPLDRRSIEMLARNAQGEAQAKGGERRDQIILATVEEPQVRSCLALIQRPPEGEPVLSVSISYIDWSPELVSRLGEAFGLSESETDVLDGYLNNLTAREVAALRGRSPETVKVQSKAILRKTGCPKMHDVMQLSASIAYLLRLHAPAKAAPGEPWTAPRRDMRLLRRPGGREAAFYVNGDGSRTVLFVHGLIQGPFFSRRFLGTLAGADLRIVSPSRPGFGFTSPARSRSADKAVVEDALAILDSLEADKVLVVSTKVGACHACRIVTALGERATGLVIVAGGPPVFNEENLAQMDAQTRMAAVTARYAPAMLKLMTRLGIAAYRRRGVSAFLERYFQGSPRDLAHLEDPEHLRIATDGVYHVVQQGPDAWVRDSVSTMSGWGPDHLAVKVPQLWLHGTDDRIASAASMAAYLQAIPDCELEVVEAAGIQLIHEHPELVVDRIARMAG